MTEPMAGPPASVTVYWRRYCPHCMRLRWQIRRARLPTRELNIWEDSAAAANLRSITGGDEIVPTVVIGSQALVNPTIKQTLALVAAEAPHLLGKARRWRATGTG